MLHRNAAPGGWESSSKDFDLRYYSDDDTIPADASSLAWDKLIIEATERAGREPSPGPKLEVYFQVAGFRKVTKRQFKVPIGSWLKAPALKEVGSVYLAQMIEGLEGFSLGLMCDVLGWAEEEVKKFLEKVRREFTSGKQHIYMV